MTASVLGVQLLAGDVIVDLDGSEHQIATLDEYPGRFVGDHARLAHDGTEGWSHTICDRKHYQRVGAPSTRDGA